MSFEVIYTGLDSNDYHVIRFKDFSQEELHRLRDVELQKFKQENTKLRAENAELKIKMSAMISVPAFNKMSDDLAKLRAASKVLRDALDRISERRMSVYASMRDMMVDQIKTAREALAKFNEMMGGEEVK